MTFILPSFGASAISAVPGGGGGGAFSNTYSVETDGTNDNIAIGVDPFGNLQGSGNRLGITGTSHTICFWMKITGTIPHRVNFFYNSSIQIRTRTDGFRFYSSGTNKHHIHTITAGTWYFLALSCDGTNHTSYVKSASDDLSATVTGNSFTPTGYATFGPSCNANYDEFATFNSALSASDISNIYNNGVPGALSGYTSLAGHWRMGDSDGDTGTTITDEKGGEDAHLRNGPTFSTDVPVAPLSNDYSVSLDGTDDQVVYNSTSGNQTALGSFTGDMSFCFWIKLSSGADIMSTHSTYNSASASGTFDGVRTSTGRIAFFSYSNGISAYTSPHPYLESSKSADGGGGSSGRGLSLNQWTFIAVTVDTTAQQHKLYTATESLSPSLEATKPASHALTDFANGFKLGEARGAAGGGLFDEFAIFDGKALSATEVATIWNNGEAFDYGTDASLNPVGWYRMGDNVSGTGNSVTNAGSAGSGSAFDAELTNDASFVSGAGNTPGN